MTGADASRRGDPVATLKGRLAAMPARLRAETDAALLDAGVEAVAAARRLLADAYASLPSAPGGPPRDPAGRLAASLDATLDETGSRVTIMSTTPYATALEYGTRTMAPRPFLRPAVEETRPAALDRCRQALARAVGGAE